jgi:hypothetical protein
LVREWQERTQDSGGAQGVKYKVEGIDMCGAILEASGGEEGLAEYFTCVSGQLERPEGQAERG